MHIAFAQTSPAAAAVPVERVFPRAAGMTLSDGTQAQQWDRPQKYSRTYWVAQGDPHASDHNPGTRRRPFLTIGRAAWRQSSGQDAASVERRVVADFDSETLRLRWFAAVPDAGAVPEAGPFEVTIQSPALLELFVRPVDAPR